LCSVCQTPEEHDAEVEIRSKESRKYVIRSLDDLIQVKWSFFIGRPSSVWVSESLTRLGWEL